MTLFGLDWQTHATLMRYDFDWRRMACIRVGQIRIEVALWRALVSFDFLIWSQTLIHMLHMQP